MFVHCLSMNHYESVMLTISILMLYQDIFSEIMMQIKSTPLLPGYNTASSGIPGFNRDIGCHE